MVNKEKKSSVKKIEDISQSDSSKVPTMLIANANDIAFDFATKVYKRFENTIKAIAYFGSSARGDGKPESDIDIIVIIDDVTINWDEEIIATYREELAKIVQRNPYVKPIHVNTVKLSLWYQDLIRGDPVVMNILRTGQPLIDHGGFFLPFKMLLQQGKIRPTPEAISALLERSPQQIARARFSMLGALDGLYWACVDSAHAALIAADIIPPSPEQMAENLKERFVKQGLMNSKELSHFEEVFSMAREVIHGKRMDISGKKLDELFENTNSFVSRMADIVQKITRK